MPSELGVKSTSTEFSKWRRLVLLECDKKSSSISMNFLQVETTGSFEFK